MMCALPISASFASSHSAMQSADDLNRGALTSGVSTLAAATSHGTPVRQTSQFEHAACSLRMFLASSIAGAVESTAVGAGVNDVAPAINANAVASVTTPSTPSDAADPTTRVAGDPIMSVAGDSAPSQTLQPQFPSSEVIASLSSANQPTDHGPDEVSPQPHQDGTSSQTQEVHDNAGPDLGPDRSGIAIDQPTVAEIDPVVTEITVAPQAPVVHTMTFDYRFHRNGHRGPDLQYQEFYAPPGTRIISTDREDTNVQHADVDLIPGKDRLFLSVYLRTSDLDGHQAVAEGHITIRYVVDPDALANLSKGQLVDTLQNFDRESLREALEGIRPDTDTLKVAINHIDLDTLMVGLKEVDQPTLVASLKVITDRDKNGRLEYALEHLDPDRLLAGLEHVDAKTCIDGLQVIDRPTLRLALEKFDPDTLRTGLKGTDSQKGIDEPTLNIAMQEINDQAFQRGLKVVDAPTANLMRQLRG